MDNEARDVGETAWVVAVKLDRALHSQLRTAAALEGRTIIELNNEAVRAWIQLYEDSTGFRVPAGPLLTKREANDHE